MSGALVVDTTHCISWDPTTRVLTCGFFNKAAAFADGRVSHAHYALDTSPTPPASGLLMARALALLRYTVAFHFNEALTKAVLISQPSLLSCAHFDCRFPRMSNARTCRSTEAMHACPRPPHLSLILHACTRPPHSSLICPTCPADSVCQCPACMPVSHCPRTSCKLVSHTDRAAAPADVSQATATRIFRGDA
jgi:hypothetical protein